MSDATRCAKCGGPFDAKRIHIAGSAYHERCADIRERDAAEARGVQVELRNAAAQFGGAHGERYREAADEIARLTRALAEKEGELDTARVEWREAMADIERLRELYDAARASEARMREALEIIADERQCLDTLMSHVEIARTALGRVADYWTQGDLPR